MNKNSNTYIIIYSSVMVVVVALVLAFASLSLQPRQTANEENEMKGALLAAVGEGLDADRAADKTAYIDEQFGKYITESFVVDAAGGTVQGADAFAVLKGLKDEYDKPLDQRLLPVFVSRADGGDVRYIFPVWGTGLWGPLWGYVALESDLNTVYGVVFDHKGETPGLGAEIASDAFEGQFRWKTILDDGRLVAVSVTKGAGSSAGNPHAVDAITGGTITSRGVEKMIHDGLEGYLVFIERQRNGHDDSENQLNDEAI